MPKVIMHCSTLKTKGGMVSVTKNYLGYQNWDEYEIKFIPTHYDTNKYLLMLYFGFRYLQILFTLFTGDYRIAHLHTAERGSFWRKRFLMKTYHKFGIKVILHHHAAEFEDFYNNCSQKQKDKIQQTLAEADVNIVLSKRLVPTIKEKAPAANVEVLYNAVECGDNNPYSLDSKNILFLGRLGKRKGTFDLLFAIKRIDNMIPQDVKFYLCGDVGEDIVKKKVEELGIQHRIAHVGWIDGNLKNQILAETMINCLPSYNEGLPMTILETMSKGIPNISTNIASIPEVIINDENGFLIKPGDVDALSQRLVSLINDPNLRKRFSDNSYNTVKNGFSLDYHITKLKHIYDELVNCSNNERTRLRN